MAWFTRFTRFGDVHMVYAQENECSCGIAAVMMTVFKINELVPGAQAMYKEQEVYDVYSDVIGSKYDGTAYTYVDKLATVLNRLNVGTWEAVDIGAVNVPQAIVDSVGIEIVGVDPLINELCQGDPIIILIRWDDGDGHIVVVDTVNSWSGRLYASVCDPWDGDVHITRFKIGKPFHYEAEANVFSWDLGGKRHEYKGTRPGEVKGWVVRKIG